MLTSLSIKNYALIDDIRVRFGSGLSIITGETGAGKSILLGGLSLILGKRADPGALKNKDEKCVVEAEFAIAAYHLNDFFAAQDIDFDEKTIVRREILPGGKSRAFVNDTPVTLNTLSLLAGKLIDIHSQHETLQLKDDDFQFEIIDAIASNATLLKQYREKLSAYHQTKKNLQRHIDLQKEAEKEYDYHSFLLKELREAKLQDGMLEELETTYEKLSNTEEIVEKLSGSLRLLDEEEHGLLASLNELKQLLSKLSAYGKPFQALYERINSTYIELDDAYAETRDLLETMDTDPQLLEQVNARLQLIYSLQKKHNALTVAELLEKQAQLEADISVTENLDAEIREAQLRILKLEEELDAIAIALHENRKKAAPEVATHIETTLKSLGIKNARIRIDLKKTESYLLHGKDELELLFSANKGIAYEKLHKVASGGELSRIMLAVKALLAQYTSLPAIIFDEIDTGVSGAVAGNVGEIIRQMSTTMQVIAITHLPQVAAKGDTHFKVYKEDGTHDTRSGIKQLDAEERIAEIAAMLGGKDNTESAVAHARNLLSL